MRTTVSHEVSHRDIDRVDGDIFTVTFTPDCMTHACRCRDVGDLQRNDACCQHGADVLIPEKRAILRRVKEISAVLKPERRDPRAWFDERDPEEDPEAPGGILLRTATTDLNDDSSGCVFLEHDGDRGCGLHRAAVLNGFDPAAIKPRVCRLYPLSWWQRKLGLSPDFDRYSCANGEGPTVYRLMRDTVAEIFGVGLVRQLDRLETRVLRRKLPVVRRAPTLQDRAPE